MVTSPTIFNLSSKILDSFEIELLTKGPKFTPTPLYCSTEDYTADMLSLSRKLKLAHAYNNSNANKCDGSLIHLKSDKPGPKPKDHDLLNLCNQLDKLKPSKTNRDNVKPYQHPTNMTPPLYSALKKLRESNLILKEADKGSGIVMMDADYYNSKLRNF